MLLRISEEGISGKRSKIFLALFFVPYNSGARWEAVHDNSKPSSVRKKLVQAVLTVKLRECTKVQLHHIPESK
jgi:hypothetical protein